MTAVVEFNRVSLVEIRVCDCLTVSVRNMLLFFLDLLSLALDQAEEARGVQNRVFQVAAHLVVARVPDQSFFSRLERQTNGSHPLLLLIADDLYAFLTCDAQDALVGAKIDA